MNTEKLNRWLALLANFGVVIGLALLVFELRQTQHLAQTEANVQRLNQMQEAQLSFAMSESLALIKVKALSDGVQSLSAEKPLRLQSWEYSTRLRMQSQYIQYVRGYLDQETAGIIVQAAADRLPYWEELGIELGNSELDQAIKQAAGR